MRSRVEKTWPQGNLLLAVAVITLTILGSACTAQEIRYVSTPLELPERPVLPAIKEPELKDLSDETYRKLEERDRERRQYSERLENVIKSTKEKAP